MAEQLILEALGQWDRAGRGHQLQFYATDEEVQEWLLQALSPEYAPYHLVGADLVKEGRFYIEQPFSCEVSALLSCMQGAEAPRDSFWIRSEVLTPSLPLERGMNVTRVCALNGLVLLQHGTMIADNREPARPVRRYASCIGIVARIRNLESGELRQHDGYLRVYQALRKAIKRALVYTSIDHDARGNEWEDTHLCLWTAGAVRRHQEGFLFWSRPGRQLREAGKG